MDGSPLQKGSSWEGAVLEGVTCLQGYGRVKVLERVEWG